MALLQAEEVEVRFGGLLALTDVNLEADAGRVTGLIGPNGAGKTTFFNVICGLQPPTNGVVRFEGIDITGRKTHERARLGIARTFQRLELFGSLSAYENVLAAAEIRRRWSKNSGNPRALAEAALERVGITHVRNERADSLPTGMARLVEVARALVTGPRLLLLDEPSSGLSDTESEAFGDLLLELASDGLGILMVEHDVELVMRVCAWLHVLDFGRLIAVGTPEEIQASEAVQQAYLGTGSNTDGEIAADEVPA